MVYHGGWRHAVSFNIVTDTFLLVSHSHISQPVPADKHPQANPADAAGRDQFPPPAATAAATTTTTATATTAATPVTAASSSTSHAAGQSLEQVKIVGLGLVVGARA